MTKVVPPSEMNVPMLERYIELLTAARVEIRRKGASAARVEQEISEAWDHLRRARAAQRNGKAPDIIRRARVERELQKLMGAEVVDE